MYQLLGSAMLGVAAVALVFGSHIVIAGALIAAGLFAVADALAKK